MASFVYEPMLGIGLKELVTLDLRAALVMDTSTAGTEPESTVVAAFSLLDEYDGAGYARQPVASLSQAVDLANSRAELQSAPIVFAALGAGARNAIGVLIYQHVTDDSDSKPYAFFALSPFNGNGQDVTLSPNVEGMIQARNAP